MNFFQQSGATAAYRRIYFRLVSTTDGESGVTGAVVSGTIRKNGGLAVAQAGIVTELANGYYYYEATAAELDTLGSILYTPSATGAYTFSYEGMVVAYDPFPAPATEVEFRQEMDANSTKLAAILADTGTDGVVVATASKTGYALTAAEHTAIATDVQTGLTAQGLTTAVANYLRLGGLLSSSDWTATNNVITLADGSTVALTYTGSKLTGMNITEAP